MTIAQQLNITEFPFDIKNEEGKLIYTELSNGYWCKWEFDQDGNLIYTEDSDGYILHKRPKPEPELEKNLTAVEWLECELKKIPFINVIEVFNQAKAIEKEQIINSNRDGADMVMLKKNFVTGEAYYNETYKGGDK